MEIFQEKRKITRRIEKRENQFYSSYSKKKKDINIIAACLVHLDMFAFTM